jgi:hypothetical protein
MAGKFAVGEFADGNIGNLQNWANVGVVIRFSSTFCPEEYVQQRRQLSHVLALASVVRRSV